MRVHIIGENSDSLNFGLVYAGKLLILLRPLFQEMSLLGWKYEGLRDVCLFGMGARSMCYCLNHSWIKFFKPSVLQRKMLLTWFLIHQLFKMNQPENHGI